MKRRRSVKISSVALESVQWQNDALQILTCASDYKSMNDFLMKKVMTVFYLNLLQLYLLIEEKNIHKLVLISQITDLDTEDGKKDTMVDVVFKKALKEFRLNIFNSYSTALAVSTFIKHLFYCFYLKNDSYCHQKRRMFGFVFAKECEFDCPLRDVMYCLLSHYPWLGHYV